MDNTLSSGQMMTSSSRIDNPKYGDIIFFVHIIFIGNVVRRRLDGEWHLEILWHLEISVCLRSIRSHIFLRRVIPSEHEFSQEYLRNFYDLNYGKIDKGESFNGWLKTE